MASKKNSKLNAKEAAKRAPAKYKLQQVKKLAMLIDENKTIMFASIKSLPTKQFQKIKKNLEKEVFFIVAKKNITTRAIESSKKQNIHELKDHIKEDNAILISQMDAFDLAGKLAESKSPVKAKVGQIAEMDIHIEPGPTELVAGPVVSELGALGLKIEIKGGKIEKKETLIQMKNYFAKAKAFAVLINYISKDTIGFLLAKAASHERAIESIINVPQTETKSEEKSE